MGIIPHFLKRDFSRASFVPPALSIECSYALLSSRSRHQRRGHSDGHFRPNETKNHIIMLQYFSRINRREFFHCRFLSESCFPSLVKTWECFFLSYILPSKSLKNYMWKIHLAKQVHNLRRIFIIQSTVKICERRWWRNFCVTRSYTKSWRIHKGFERRGNVSWISVGGVSMWSWSLQMLFFSKFVL